MFLYFQFLIGRSIRKRDATFLSRERKARSYALSEKSRENLKTPDTRQIRKF